MAKLTRAERFIRSKCDRCGKATKARQNDIGDLYTLPTEWPAPLGDTGDFCQPCIERYDEADWRAWFRELRAYANMERWETECLALGAKAEEIHAYDESALTYVRTTLYPNQDVVAYARRLAREALARGEAMPTSAEQAIDAENKRAIARFLGM